MLQLNAQSGHGWLVILLVTLLGFGAGSGSLAQSLPGGGSPDPADQVFHDRFEGPPNQPPVIEPIPDQTIPALSPFSYQVIATDPAPPWDVLRYALDQAPAGMGIDAQGGLIEWLPSEEQAGKHPVLVRVSDAYGGVALEDFQITVLDAKNQPPTLEAIGDRSIRVDQVLSLQPVATDPDLPNDALSFSLQGAPSGLSLATATGLITWAPTEAQIGQWLMSLTVTDQGGLSDSTSFTVTVTGLGSPPSIEAIPDQSLLIGELLDITAQASDPDLPDDALSFSLLRAPQGMSINTTTGRITWTPGADRVGAHDVSVQVADQIGLIDFTDFVVQVRAPNQAPVALDDEYRVRSGDTLTVPAPGVMDNDFDPDGDAIIAELLSGPSRGVLNEFNPDGSFSYTPGIGEQPIEFAEVCTSAAEFSNVGFLNQYPIVIDLDGDGVPEIIWVDSNSSAGGTSLRAMSMHNGNCELLWETERRGSGVGQEQDPDYGVLDDRQPLAAGDVTGDGRPEIAVVVYRQPCSPDLCASLPTRQHIALFNADGEFLWISDPVAALNDPDNGDSVAFRYSVPHIADLTGDGQGEIVLGMRWGGAGGGPAGTNARFVIAFRHVEDGDGTLRGEVFFESRGTPAFTGATGVHQVHVVDLNLDGEPEILFENDLFSNAGDLLYTFPVPWRVSATYQPGQSLVSPIRAAIVNLDDDLFPEVVFWQDRALSAFKHDGTEIWRGALPGAQMGALTAADLTGDGWPEIVLNPSERFEAWDRHGNRLWESERRFQAVLSHGATAFDLNQNGRKEVVISRDWAFDGNTEDSYAVVLDGLTGKVIAEMTTALTMGRTPSSRTMPVIADATGDGRANLVTWMNGSGQNWVTIIGGTEAKPWGPARPIWNQYTYHVTNINPDGTMPDPPKQHWLEPGLNSYHVNALPVAERIGAEQLAAFKEVELNGQLNRVFIWPLTPSAQKLTVADLTGDGRPEILTVIYVQGSPGFNPVHLAALSFDPDSGSLEPLWIVSNNRAFPDQADFAIGWASRDPAVGDVTGDGVPEVVHPSYCRGGFLVFSNLGEPIFSSVAGEVPDCESTGAGSGRGRVALVDLTGDGLPEILNFRRGILNAYTKTGPEAWDLLWSVDAPNFNPSPGATEWDYLIADVNLDGRPNIYFGHSLFDADGSLLWSAPVSNMTQDFWHAVANLDDDPFGELLTLSHRVGLVARNHDGSCLWNARPGSSPISGCPVLQPFPNGNLRARGVLVASLMGDAKPQIVSLNGEQSSGNHFVTVHDHDGSLRWQVPVLMSDGTPNRGTAVQAFDLTGNGRMEVIVTGHRGTVVLNADDGSLLFELRADGFHPGGGVLASYNPVTSVVADMTGDGRGELVIAANGATNEPADQAAYGIFIYRDVLARSASARNLWNQWNYSVSNVNPDLSIPASPRPNWLTPGLNNYRVNAVMPGEPGGFDTFTYRVGDGELTSNEATVYIDIRRPNRPPVFVSSPVTRAGVGMDYRYRVRAVDPDPGDEATVRLDIAPTGMVLDGSGTLRWQPSASDLGDHAVMLSAIDLEGEITLQEFTLSVLEPLQVPDLLGLSQSAAEAELVAAGLQTGRVDDIHDPVVTAGLVLDQAPGAGGWVLPGDVVNLVLSLGPSPVAPNFPPDRPVEAIFIDPGELTLLQGQWRQLEAFALLDDGSEHRLADPTWTASGAVAVSGQGRVTASSAGTGTVTAQFQDFSAEIEVTVLARVPDDDQAPAALLISPADGAQISERVPVIGTAFDDNLVHYKLEIGPPGGGRWEILAEGFDSVFDDVLGHLDATLLDNGLWRLRLTVLDAGGNQSVDEISVVLDGDLKAGLFSLSFVDLELPLAGVPIRIEREYDSRRRQPGEFGPGWRLGVRATELRCTAPLGAGWQVASGGLSFLLLSEEEKLCTVRLADGRLERFDFRPSVTASPFVPFSLFGSSFVPLPGTRGRLEPLANTNLLIADPQPGEVVLLDDTSLNLFNPRRFRYIDRDGTETVLSLDTGIESISDRNGNTLSFEAGGIFHSNGESISFQRDPLGRIVRLVDPAGNEQHYQYGNNGDLIAHIDAEGFETRYRYNRRHGLVGIIDPLDRPLMRNEYDADGRLIRMTTAEGRVIDLSHDLVARQQILTDTDGTQTIIQYDARGNILQVVDQDGRMTSHSYDEWDNQVSTTTPDGRTSSRTFDARGNLTSRTNPLGHTVSYTWDSDNNLTSRTDELGWVTQFEYDSRGNLLRVIGPDGQVQLEQGFDALGQLVVRANGLGETEQLGYDDRGRLNSLTDARGNTWTADHDALGRPIGEVDRLGVARTRAFDARGFMTETIDGDGAITGWDFDPAGQLSGVIDPLGGINVFSHDGAGRLVEQVDPLGRMRQTEYTDQDFPARRIDPLGRATETRYDALGRPTEVEHPDGAIQQVAYDNDGRLVSQTDARGNVTSFAWDNAGRLISQTDPLGHSVSYAFDAAGNRVSRTDQRGHLTLYAYDERNRLVSTTHPDGAVETQTWDAADRLARRTDPLGRHTDFEYDANGNLVKVIDALGGETRYGYDAENRLVSQIDANGRATAYSYDAEGRLTGIVWPDGSSEQRQYDAAGQLVKVERPGGGRVEIERDIAGQILERRIGGGEDYAITWTASGMMQAVNDSRGSTEYLHDARDRLLAEILPDGSRIDYSYDVDGHLVALAVQIAGEQVADEVSYGHDGLGRLVTMTDATGTTAFTWDPAGNLSRIEQPNGVVTDFTHDVRNRITRIEVRANGTDLARHDYSYNLAGEPQSVVMLDGSRIDWQHDALGRLIRETRRNAADEVVFDERHVLDAVGNRIERIDELTGATETYVYDASDRLLSDGQGSYLYDADGNLIQANGSGLQRSYQWDADGRLIGFADGLDSSRSRAYTYDHLGHRVASSGALGTVGYVNALINPTGWVQTVAEIAPDGQRQASLRFGPGLINQARDGQTRFHHADRLGSHILLTNASGQVTDRYAYTAYGEAWASEGSFANPIRFAGERLDAERNQYWLRARHYDPRQGRFLSRDPFLGLEGLPISRHRYLYAHASPVMHTDPSGLLSLSNFAVTYASIGDLQKSYSGMLLKTYKEARAIGNEFLAVAVGMREYALMAMTDPRTSGTGAQHAFGIFENSQGIIADSLQMIVAKGAQNAREWLATWWLPTVKFKVGRLEWNLTSMTTDALQGQRPSLTPDLNMQDHQLENTWKASKGIYDVVTAIKDGEDADTATMSTVIGLLD